MEIIAHWISDCTAPFTVDIFFNNIDDVTAAARDDGIIPTKQLLGMKGKLFKKHTFFRAIWTTFFNAMPGLCLEYRQVRCWWCPGGDLRRAHMAGIRRRRRRNGLLWIDKLSCCYRNIYTTKQRSSFIATVFTCRTILCESDFYTLLTKYREANYVFGSFDVPKSVGVSFVFSYIACKFIPFFSGCHGKATTIYIREFELISPFKKRERDRGGKSYLKLTVGICGEHGGRTCTSRSIKTHFSPPTQTPSFTRNSKIKEARRSLSISSVFF